MSPAHQTAAPDRHAIHVPPAREVVAQRSHHHWLIVVGAGFVLMLLVRGFFVQSYYIPSQSMEPTLEPNDRLLVNKVDVSSSLHRGDLVVFDGTRAFGNESDYVKRVIGLPGDHVLCCDAAGHLTVNGTSVKEPYLYSGDQPSDLSFDVTVPAERIWVMGDHRSVSADSRAHLGDPGGGMVRLDDVIGRAAMVYWPPSRAGVLGATESPENIAASTAGERHK
jgi:signal peptidase I, bacterial type